MTTVALLLVLLSAALHAVWNLFAKRAGGGVAFVWLADVVAVAFSAPLVVWLFLVEKPVIGPLELLMMAGSAVLHLTYFITLLRGYRAGDFSLVYPLARGTGPLIATIGAVLILGERPTVPALFGTLLIVGGAFFLTGGVAALKAASAGRAALYGLITGLIIGAYTLWDTVAVAVVMISPMIQYYGSSLGRVVLLIPLLRTHRAELKREWRTNKVALAAVGILGQISYVLVLTALTLSPVSLVAPAREISILLGTLLGARLLAEGDVRRRLASSAAMVLGVVALSLS